MNDSSRGLLTTRRSGGVVLACILGSFLVHGVAYAVLRVIKKPEVKQRTSEDIVQRRKDPEPKKRHKVQLQKKKQAPVKKQVVKPREIKRAVVRRPTMAPPPMAAERPQPMAVLNLVPMGAGVSESLTSEHGVGTYFTGNSALGDPSLDPRRAPMATKPMASAPMAAPPPPMQRAAVVVYVKQLPQVVTVPQVAYPAQARRQQIEGTVRLLVTVGTKGQVLRVKVLKGIGYGLDEAAVRALRRARFKPALGSNGRPMVYTIRYRYTFRLER